MPLFPPSSHSLNHHHPYFINSGSNPLSQVKGVFILICRPLRRRRRTETICLRSQTPSHWACFGACTESPVHASESLSGSNLGLIYLIPWFKFWVHTVSLCTMNTELTISNHCLQPCLWSLNFNILFSQDFMTSWQPFFMQELKGDRNNINFKPQKLSSNIDCTGILGVFL